MLTASKACFSGTFTLRDGVTEVEFLPAIESFFAHFVEVGYATGYIIARQEPTFRSDPPLPIVTYRGYLLHADIEQSHRAYDYVRGNTGPVRDLHLAMRSMLGGGAEFRVEEFVATS